MAKPRKFYDGGHIDDDPYDELFADCQTPEDVMQLQTEIEEAERS
jgi:hypothetical protein